MFHMETDIVGIFGTNQKRGQDYNKLAVFEHIRRYGPVARMQIAAQTLLVPQTVSNLVRALIAEGLVIEVSERDQARSDRKPGVVPTNLTVRSDAKFAIGVQIQYSRVVALVMNLTGDVLLQTGAPIVDRDFEKFRDTLFGYVDDLLRSLDDPQALLGIGIGVPRIHTKSETAAPGRHDLPIESTAQLKTEFAARYGADILLGNNAQMAAVGEYWLRRGNAPASFFYVYIGDNIGAGMMRDGDRYTGQTGRALEFGHIQYEPGGRPCYCGMRGCLDQYGSPNAIRRDLGLSDSESLAAVSAVAQAGDARAVQVMSRAGQAIAESVASALVLLDLPVCIIGGPNAAFLEKWVESPLRALLSARQLKTEIWNSDSGINAGAIGAASAVIHDALWCNPINLLKTP